VRVGAAKRVEEYRWSSYREYVYEGKGGGLADTDETLGFFSKQRDSAVRKYKEFVEAGIQRQAKRLLDDATGSVFRERVLKFIKTPFDKLEITEVRKIKRAQEIQDIVMGIAGYDGLTEEDLLKRRRRTEGQRKIAVY